MRFLQSLTTLVALAVPSLAQLGVNDLFRVDFTTNNLGGCQYVGEQRMNQIIQDSYNILGAGIQLLDDYATLNDARRLSEAFWRGADQTQRNTIRGRYATVRNWLANGGPVNAGQQTQTPRLYCHHGWLRRQNMGDPAYDQNGVTFNNLQNMQVRVQDVDIFRLRQQSQAQSLNLPLGSIYPYWSLVDNYYIFDQGYSSGPNTGFCSPGGDAAIAGVTDHFLVSTITLCPSAFGTNNNRPSNWNYRGLRSLATNPTTWQQVNQNANENMQRFSPGSELWPTATTFTHELFHLVLGNDPGVTNPVTRATEIYTIEAMLNAQLVDSMANPHSYTTAAVAYDYTTNSATNAAGFRIEFYTGFTTQG